VRELIHITTRRLMATIHPSIALCMYSPATGIFWVYPTHVTLGSTEVSAMFMGQANIPEAADYGQHHRHLPHSH
jgi:hypothetical protein